MKHILVTTFITLLALATGCAWISPAAETASDGIQVHGHWTMTVTNPDGTLDAVHEFENALAESGADLLTLLLSNQNTGPLTWRIIPSNYSGTKSKDLKCLETVHSIQFSDSYQHELLAIQDRDSHLNGSPFRLTASCSVAGLPEGESSQLKAVWTGAYREGDNFQGATAFSDSLGKEVSVAQAGGVFYFTKHHFSPYIPITNGQHLSFNVVITFE